MKKYQILISILIFQSYIIFAQNSEPSTTEVKLTRIFDKTYSSGNEKSIFEYDNDPNNNSIFKQNEFQKGWHWCLDPSLSYSVYTNQGITSKYMDSSLRTE